VETLDESGSRHGGDHRALPGRAAGAGSGPAGERGAHEGGKRADLKPIGAGLLAYGKKVEVPSGRWSTLRVEARRSRFSVSFDGNHLFDVEDATFAGAGKVGLWTKADSVTAFADLVTESLEGGEGSRREEPR
jgi:hypothetical protein